MELADGTTVEVARDEVTDADHSKSLMKAGLVGAGAAASAAALASALGAGDSVDTPQGPGKILSSENVCDKLTQRHVASSVWYL